MPDVGAGPTPWRADDVEASRVPQVPDRRRPLESLVEQHKLKPLGGDALRLPPTQWPWLPTGKMPRSWPAIA
jgi:hypothetical protein